MVSNIGFRLSVDDWAEATKSVKHRPTITPRARAIGEEGLVGNSLEAPILFYRGFPTIDAVRWGWSDKQTTASVHYVAAAGRSYGYRCLILISGFEVAIGDAPTRQFITFKPSHGK